MRSTPLSPPGNLPSGETPPEMALRISPAIIRMRSTVKCRPPNTTTCPSGIVKQPRRNGVITLLRGRVKISAMTMSIPTATAGFSVVSAAPPPNRQCSGSMELRP